MSSHARLNTLLLPFLKGCSNGLDLHNVDTFFLDKYTWTIDQSDLVFASRSKINIPITQSPNHTFNYSTAPA